VIFPSPPPYEDQATDAALLWAIVVIAVVIVVVTSVGVTVFWIHIEWKLAHRYPAALNILNVAPAVAPIARAKVVPYDSESIV
jgi:hypothetical protein